MTSAQFLVVGIVSLIVLVGLLLLGGGDADLGDGDADAGDADAAGTGEGGGVSAAALLSVRLWLAALAGGGIAGWAAGTAGAAAFAWPAAAAGAIIGAWAWRRVVRLLGAFDEHQRTDVLQLVGREGVLTIGIGPGEASGVLQVVLGGSAQDFTARADEPVEAGTRVVVLEVSSPTEVRVVPASRLLDS